MRRILLTRPLPLSLSEILASPCRRHQRAATRLLKVNTIRVAIPAQLSYLLRIYLRANIQTRTQALRFLLPQLPHQHFRCRSRARLDCHQLLARDPQQRGERHLPGSCLQVPRRHPTTTGRCRMASRVVRISSPDARTRTGAQVRARRIHNRLKTSALLAEARPAAPPNPRTPVDTRGTPRASPS